MASPRYSRCASWGGRSGIATDYAGFPRGLAPLPAPLFHPFGESRQHLCRIVPADAAVGDALAVLERLAGDDLLPPLDQVRFHHHADDALLTAGELRGDVGRDVYLPLVL